MEDPVKILHLLRCMVFDRFFCTMGKISEVTSGELVEAVVELEYRIMRQHSSSTLKGNIL